jgi:hypothetical protein
MSLPTRQQRVLDQIEKTFQARDPWLTSLFATFARLNSHEAMPASETLTGRLSRFLRPVVVVPLVLVFLAGAVVAGSFIPGPHCSTAQASAGIAHGQVSGKSAGGCADGIAGSGAPAIARR